MDRVTGLSSRYQPVSAWKNIEWRGETVQCRQVKDLTGGPNWSEIKSSRHHRWERQIPDEMGPDWQEVDLIGLGQPERSRSYPDPHGELPWTEHWGSMGRYRQKDFGELAQLCQRQGHNQLEVNGNKIDLWGKLQPQQLEMVGETLRRMPSNSLWDGLALYFAGESFKEQKDPMGQSLGSASGIAVRKSQIFLLRDSLYPHVIAHEIGHVVDSNQGGLCLKSPWGQAPYLSGYAASKPDEDLAETFAASVLDWNRLESLDADDWAQEPARDKKMAIVSLYSDRVVNGPHFPQVGPPVHELPFLYANPPTNTGPVDERYLSREWLEASMRTAI